VYSLRWLGANEDPDIFEYAFDSARIIPNGANRQYYRNPHVDQLIAKAQTELDQNARKQDYAQIQQILAEDLPYVDLWYFDNVMVYSKRVGGLQLNPSGNYNFLKTADLVR
jgi:peptide/nickel transport system substrate-binding protein